MYIFRFITLDRSLIEAIIGFYADRFVTHAGILLHLMLHNGLDFVKKLFEKFLAIKL